MAPSQSMREALSRWSVDKAIPLRVVVQANFDQRFGTRTFKLYGTVNADVGAASFGMPKGAIFDTISDLDCRNLGGLQVSRINAE